MYESTWIDTVALFIYILHKSRIKYKAAAPAIFRNWAKPARFQENRRKRIRDKDLV